MKFPSAWASIASQNVTLKVALFTLSFCLTALALTAIKLALRDPLIIERACYSRTLSYSTQKPTKTEIEAFLYEALAIRFNSVTAVKKDFLAISELNFREKEQQELTQRQMKQTLIINGVDINEDQITVDADRLISIGKIKSAFSFPLKASVSSTDRTDANPYGLVLTKVTPFEQKEHSK